MLNAPFNSITRLRIHSDGVGVRSVIFMQQCPLSCFWCCNPETRTGEDYRILTPEALYEYIKGDIPYFLASGGGITFSGGEPLLHSDFLREFISTYCQDFAVDIETSLFTTEENLNALIPLIDHWNVDFKVFDEKKHRAFTGVSNQRILENLVLLAENVPPERILITYPVIPGYNDSDENVQSMIRFMKEHGLYRLELHPYRKMAEEKHRKAGLKPTPVEPLSEEQYRHICQQFYDSGMTLISRKTLYGKDKCRYLKQLRRDLCQNRQLNVEIIDCTFDGECIGTCPRCEFELQQIGQQLTGGAHHLPGQSGQGTDHPGRIF